MNKILVIGAGFSGTVIARELAENGFHIKLIDKRNHIGGNAYDFINEYGVRIHKYGPHLFHTNNRKVFNWMSKFTEWVTYRHKVKAMLEDGRLVTLPINKETRSIVGDENLIETFIRPYSEKMWGMPLENLDPKILSRVPMRDDDNEFYFPDDEYQCMPKYGYTELFKNILNHKNIEVELGTSFDKNMEKSYSHVFNSMPIDEYYDYCYGELPYRSIKFKEHTIPIPKLFPVSVVNFTHKGKHTRVVEWKNIPGHGVNPYFTSLTFEEPCDYKENNMERFYPVKDIYGENRKLYELYAAIPKPNVTFIGRLGLYAYLDMHQCVNLALKISESYLKNHDTFNQY